MGFTLDESQRSTTGFADSPGRGGDVDDDLADGPAVGDVAQGGGRLVEPERRADVRHDRPAASRHSSSSSLRRNSSAAWATKSRNWKPSSRTPLSRTRLRGMRGIVPDAKPT